MRQPGAQDATRRHAIVTATLAAAAALVLAVMDDPAAQVAAARAGALAARTPPPDSQPRYRVYEAAARPLPAGQGIRPAVVESRVPGLAHTK